MKSFSSYGCLTRETLNLQDIVGLFNILLPDCRDLYEQGKAVNGPSNIFVHGMNSTVTVMCLMQDGGWTVLLKRETGDLDFYKDFKQYKEGFGGNIFIKCPFHEKVKTHL